MRYLVLTLMLTGCGMIPEDEAKLAQKGSVSVTCDCVRSGGGFESEFFSIQASATDCAALQARISSQCRGLSMTSCTLSRSSCPHLYL